jgi:hypothetical protein
MISTRCYQIQSMAFDIQSAANRSLASTNAWGLICGANLNWVSASVNLVTTISLSNCSKHICPQAPAGWISTT